MPEFVIERDAAGLGQLSDFQRGQTIRRTCATLHGVAPDVEWIRTYMTDSKIYCVFSSPSAQRLHDLIEQWDLPPASSICEVNEVLEPDEKG